MFGLFKKRTSLAPVDEKTDNRGVSLNWLLNQDFNGTVYQVCETIKKKCTKAYVDHLQQDAGTSRFVKEKADWFVSYAWSYDFPTLLQTIGEGWKKEKTEGEEDCFIWMDVLCLNQHVPVGNDFDRLTRTFQIRLGAIGKAFLVLTPWDDPIPIHRSWCVYEMVVMATKEIRVVPIISGREQVELFKKMQAGDVGLPFFSNLFAKINVEVSTSRDVSDHDNILKFLREAGISKVNEISMGFIKSWLIRVTSSAIDVTSLQDQLIYVLLSKAALYQSLAEYDEANHLIETALEKAQATNNNQLVAIALDQKGNVLKNSMKYGQALEAHQQALDLKLPMYGQDNIQIAISYYYLSVCHLGLHNYNEALRLSQLALDMKTALAPNNKEMIAVQLNSHAQILQRKGQFMAAENYQNQALVLDKSLNGENHQDVARDYNNLGTIQTRLGRLKEARECHERALSINKLMFGLNHPLYAATLHNIACVCEKSGKFDESLNHEQEALHVWQNSKAESLDVVKSLNYVGSILSYQKKFNEALQYHQQALRMVIALNGENDLETAETLIALALTQQSKGETEEALKNQQKALSIRTTILGNRHELVSESLNYVATLLDLHKQPEKAEPLLRQALLIDRVQGQNNVYVARDLNNLSQVLKNEGSYEEALEHALESLDLRKKIFSEEDPAIATQLYNIGHIFECQGKMDEALSHFEQALSIWKKTLNDHPNVAKAHNNIAQIKRAKQLNDEARTHGREAIRISTLCNGADHPKTQAYRKSWENF